MKHLARLSLATTISAICWSPFLSAAPTESEVTAHYANLANAVYEDSLTSARQLQNHIEALLKAPSPQALSKAKDSYRSLRVSYQQSEVMRFDAENGHVTPGLDADGGPASIDEWEGQVNAWPLDEALIDYVVAGYEGEYNKPENIINTPGAFKAGGSTIDVSVLTPEILTQLNEIGGSEANVATGIHAVEFLLWGQDTNGTGPGAGNRPVSDYFTQASQGACSSGAMTHSDASICQRRANYLQAATQLLVEDLQAMADEWSPAAQQKKGTLSNDFLTRGDGIARILDSMGDMAVGELASERMKVAILFGSTEDEHDCFSDLTHVAIQNNAQGVMNAYTGRYTRLDQSAISGPSLSDLVKAQKPETDAKVMSQLADIMQKMQAISAKAEAGQHFDQLVGGSTADKALVLDAAEALVQLGEPLSNEVAPVLKLKANEFDPGTCPGESQDSCTS
jgi:putative iron-regulated protein